jgi:hypothetical protein
MTDEKEIHALPRVIISKQKRDTEGVVIDTKMVEVHAPTLKEATDTARDIWKRDMK